MRKLLQGHAKTAQTPIDVIKPTPEAASCKEIVDFLASSAETVAVNRHV
jgi:hypothetical protein